MRCLLTFILTLSLLFSNVSKAQGGSFLGINYDYTPTKGMYFGGILGFTASLAVNAYLIQHHTFENESKWQRWWYPAIITGLATGAGGIVGASLYKNKDFYQDAIIGSLLFTSLFVIQVSF